MPVQQSELTPQVSTPPTTSASFEQNTPVIPSVVGRPQASASPQMLAALQAPAVATPFQEGWNTEISQKKGAPREREDNRRRRKL